MAAKINLAAITFNGKEVQGLREVFYSAIFAVPALNQFHTLVSGIKAKQQVVFLGQLGLSGRKLAGCDTTANTSQIPASEKFWSPEYIGDRYEECFADLVDSFIVWGLKNGLEKADLTNTEFSLFLEGRIGEAAREAVLRHVWLGNKAADNVADGGVLKAGVDPVYFNAINGFWVQMLAVIAVNAKQKVAIAKNGGAAYADQAFTDQDIADKTATKILQKMLFGADMRLRAAKDKVFIVTQSLFDQYVLERQNVANIDLAYDRVEGGIDTIQFNGVTLIPFDFLDRMIASYEDNGVKLNNPHRAVLTTKSNLQIGTEEESNLSELAPFYDQVGKKYYVDYAFNLDAMLVENHMFMAAY